MAVLEKPATTSVPVMDVVRDRWSPRSFAATPVPAAALTAVLEAGRWAASSNNGQPWRWIVATSADPAALATAVSCFNARNQRWTKTAPVLMFSCARKAFEANGNPNAHAWHDTGAAGAQMCLEATRHGLRIHQAAGIERDRIREVYGVPGEFDICAGMALGYQGEPDALPEELPGREREPRVRKPLSELVFAGKFGTAARIG
jgi:nitroreductase